MYVIGSYVYKSKLNACPPPKPIYRPLIRTFTEEQENPVSVFSMFKSMFWGGNVWLQKEPHASQLRRGKIQPFAHGELPENDKRGRQVERDDYLGRFFG